MLQDGEWVELTPEFAKECIMAVVHNRLFKEPEHDTLLAPELLYTTLAWYDHQRMLRDDLRTGKPPHECGCAVPPEMKRYEYSLEGLCQREERGYDLQKLGTETGNFMKHLKTNVFMQGVLNCFILRDVEAVGATKLLITYLHGYVSEFNANDQYVIANRITFEVTSDKRLWMDASTKLRQ